MKESEKLKAEAEALRKELVNLKERERETGIRSRCKTDYDRIDVAKAMEIWNNHQQSKK